MTDETDDGQDLLMLELVRHLMSLPDKPPPMPDPEPVESA